MALQETLSTECWVQVLLDNKRIHNHSALAVNLKFIAIKTQTHAETPDKHTKFQFNSSLFRVNLIRCGVKFHFIWKVTSETSAWNALENSQTDCAWSHERNVRASGWCAFVWTLCLVGVLFILKAHRQQTDRLHLVCYGFSHTSWLEMISVWLKLKFNFSRDLQRFIPHQHTQESNSFHCSTGYSTNKSTKIQPSLISRNFGKAIHFSFL